MALPPEPQRPLGQRLAWFGALWLGSVGALGAVALVLRRWLMG